MQDFQKQEPKVRFFFKCLFRALYRRAGHHVTPLDTIQSYWQLNIGNQSTLLPKYAERWPTLVTKWFIYIKVTVSGSNSVHVQDILTSFFL